MKKKILYLLLWLTFHQISAQQSQTLSLGMAIDTALSRNYGQQILLLSRRSSAEDLSQSKRDLLPDLQASATQGFSNDGNTGNYSLSASAILWKGGQQMNAIRRAKVALNQSDSKIAQAQNDLIIRVIQNYLTAVMNEELYNYQISVAEISKEMLQQGEARYKAGEILESDYLLLQSQYASDTYALTNSKINRENALLDLKKILCIDPDIKLEIIHPDQFSPEALALPSLEDVIGQTFAWLPDLKIAEQNRQLADLDVKIAKGAYSPTLSLGASLGTNYNNLAAGSWKSQFSDNHLQQAGFTLSVPLWDKGKSYSGVKQSRIRVQQARLEAEQTELDLRMTLEKEYLNVISLREKYEAAAISNEAYAENFRVYTVRFEKGAVSATDMLQQQNTYLSALNNYIQSKYNFWLNRKVIDVYMGNEINN